MSKNKPNKNTKPNILSKLDEKALEIANGEIPWDNVLDWPDYSECIHESMKGYLNSTTKANKKSASD